MSQQLIQWNLILFFPCILNFDCVSAVAYSKLIFWIFPCENTDNIQQVDYSHSIRHSIDKKIVNDARWKVPFFHFTLYNEFITAYFLYPSSILKLMCKYSLRNVCAFEWDNFVLFVYLYHWFHSISTALLSVSYNIDWPTIFKIKTYKAANYLCAQKKEVVNLIWIVVKVAVTIKFTSCFS